MEQGKKLCGANEEISGAMEEIRLCGVLEEITRNNVRNHVEQ